MTLTAADLQKRHQLEGAPDPFPSLVNDSPVKSTKRQQAKVEIDTDSQTAFPSLAPSSAPATPAANSAWGVPRVPKVPMFTDSFTLTAVDLSRKDGKPGTLGEVLKHVMSKFKVKIDASSNQLSHQYTFHLKADSEKELEKARRVLIAQLSPMVKAIVNAPASTIPLIIGSKGATLKQIREQTSTRIDIPPKESITSGSGSGAVTPSLGDEEEEEVMVPITVEGAAPGVEEAQALINAIIATKVFTSTQHIRDIPANALPFVLSKRSEYVAIAQPEYINLSLKAAEREITVSGEREAVRRVVEEIKSTIEVLKTELTSIKMALPKRQHRLLVGRAVDEILVKSRCAVIVAAPEDPSDDITVWGQGPDLPAGLSAVMERANSQYIHEFPLPGPIATSKQLLAYMTHIDYPNTLSTDEVAVYTPHTSVVEKAASLNIDIVGEKAAVDGVVRQVSELIGKLIGGTREVNIDWLLHQVIAGKHAKKLTQFHEKHNVSVYFPPESAEKSEVLLVYDPLAPSASLSPDDKAKHLNDVSKELTKLAKAAGEVKSQTVTVEKRWHDTVLRSLNTITGEDSGLLTKLGAAVGDATTEDVIFIRGPSSEVDRVAKEILKMVEDAKEEEIAKSYSESFEVDREYVGRIVGSQGAGVNKLRDQLDVRVDVSDDGDDKDKDKDVVKRKKVPSQKSKITITGRKENVAEARKRILAQVERLADETSEVLKIPAQYHSSLIGQSGKYAIRLEDKYGVKITFPRQNSENGEGKTREQLKADEVLLKGGRKGVAGAKSELLEAVEFEKESNNVVKFTVPEKAIPRILGKSGTSIIELKNETDTQIDIDKDESDPTIAHITIRGGKKEIVTAQNAIKAIAAQVAEEKTVTVPVEHKYHRTLIGPGGQGLKDLVARCGGPSDPRLQASLIRFPRGEESPDEVRLRGDAKLVAKIQAELEKVVADLKSRVVLGVEVPAGQHRALIGRGGQHLNEFQSRHGVQIQFPGSRSYNQVGEPENASDLEEVDKANIVKVSGPRPACEKAIQDLKSQVKPPTPEAIIGTASVPLKYHHAVLQQGAFLRNLRNFGVTVEMSEQPTQPSVPAQPPNTGASEARIDDEEDASSGATWEVTSNYQDAEDGIATWTLKARDQVGLDKAQKAVEEAVTRAESMSHVGFLTLADRSSFPRIVGSKGSNVARLRNETGADITVSKENSTIVVVGTEDAINAAKEAILAMTNRRRD